METLDTSGLISNLFNKHVRSLVRMVRLFVDDRNAAEDMVQEAFLRLLDALPRIRQPERAAAYLRSIVLNLARDHNRRGLVSLRHRLPAEDSAVSIVDKIVLREDQKQVIDALDSLPRRQRDCLVLKYYTELPVTEIAETLGLSVNTVKTHLLRGMKELGKRLGEDS
jgi:RNA polymerase sigma-70 factor (sigma-E family)